MLAAIGSLTVLGLLLGFLLGVAARYLKVEGDPLADELETLLPGAQCGQCGFPGCAPAAQALAAGQAPVTLCPPGGRALVETLANKLNVSVNLGDVEDSEPMLARIDESTCIGCAHCSKECPTEAIFGAPKQIHVVVQDACTGCGKCIDVCPTECLQLRPIPQTVNRWYWQKPLPAAA